MLMDRLLNKFSVQYSDFCIIIVWAGGVLWPAHLADRDGGQPLAARLLTTGNNNTPFANRWLEAPTGLETIR